MARENATRRVPIPAANVHRIHGEDDPAIAAGVYEATLRALFRTRPERASTLSSWTGEDGHTASLFPEAPRSRAETAG